MEEMGRRRKMKPAFACVVFMVSGLVDLNQVQAEPTAPPEDVAPIAGSLKRHSKDNEPNATLGTQELVPYKITLGPTDKQTSILITGMINANKNESAENFNCPPLPTTCTPDKLQKFAQLKTILLDPGHDDSPSSNRSDWAKVDTGGSKTTAPKVGIPDPSRVAQDIPFEEQSGSAKAAHPMIHEGQGALAISMLQKIFFDRCAFKNVADSSRPKIKLTRWPGESDRTGKKGRPYGSYEDPDFSNQFKKATGFTPYIQSEIGMMSGNRKPGTDNNSAHAWYYNSLLNWSNKQLGVKNPYVWRHQTTTDTLPLAPGVLPPSQSEDALVISTHLNTANPKSRLRQVVRSDTVLAMIPRYVDPNRLPTVAEESQAYPTLSNEEYAKILASSPEYRQEYALAQNLQNSITRSLQPHFTALTTKEKQEQYAKEWGSNPVAGGLGLLNEGKEPPLPKTSGVSVLSYAVRAKYRVLVEGLDMTGWAREEIARQVTDKSRLLSVKVNDTTYDYPISDYHIAYAKGVVTGALETFCGN